MGDDGIEWELEDLDGGVLYDVFYESTTMLAGRMLAQRRPGWGASGGGGPARAIGRPRQGRPDRPGGAGLATMY